MKICLGTVQFGLNYGINNDQGKPTDTCINDIMDYAINHGVCCFDTSSAYGESETSLGRYFGNKPISKVEVISKLTPSYMSDIGQEYSGIKNEVEASIKRLRIKRLKGYLFHNPEHIYNLQYVEAMKRIKAEGLVENFGVSIYKPEDALYAVKKANVDYIQIPYNIFDQRLSQTDFFQITEQKGIKVFARSPFLQGFVFMTEKDVVEKLSFALTYKRQLNDILKKYKSEVLEASLKFSYDNKGIDYVLFGVDSQKQLKQSLDVLNGKKLNSSLYQKLLRTFELVDEKLITPSMW